MHFNRILFTILATLLIFTSCNQSSDLSNAIPADANYILRIDTKSLVEKSQYDLFKNPTVQQGLNMYRVFLKDDAKIKLLDDFLKNSNALGLDVKGEVYVFSNLKVYGVVIGVNDADKLKEVVSGLYPGNDLNVTKDGNTYSITPGSDGAIAWNNKRFVILADIRNAYNDPGNAADALDVNQLSKDLLVQGADKSINSNKEYVEFAKTQKDFSVFFSMKGLDKMESLGGLSYLPYGLSYMDPMKKFLSQFEGVSTGVNGSFEKGEVVLSSKYYFESPESEKKFKDLVAQMSGTIKGDHLKFLESDPLAAFVVNVKGAGMFDYLKTLGIISKSESDTESAKLKEQLLSILQSCEGDVTMALTSFEKKNANGVKPESVTEDIKIEGDSGESDEELLLDDSYSARDNISPKFFIMADVSKPDDIKRLLSDLIKENEFVCENLEEGKYLVDLESEKVYFGVNKNTFFATNNKTVYENLNNEGLKNNFTELVKGKSVAFFGDFAKLKELSGVDRSIDQFIPYLVHFDKYQYTANTADLSGEGKVTFIDKDKNSLAVICDQIDKAITNLGSMF